MNRRAAIVVLALVVGGGLVVYGGSGVIRVRAMQQEIRHLERELHTLR